MPRNGRGGPRQGVEGRVYPNRSDMQQGPRQPVTASPGQTYGQRKAQEDAQKVIPLPRKPMAPPRPLDGPTARPEEPITAGAPFGPGPTPAMPATLRDQDVEHLRLYLPALEAMASQPGASPSFRQMVRFVRGSVPV